MKILIHNNYTGNIATVDGSRQEVQERLLNTFPWFRKLWVPETGLNDLIDLIDGQQGYSVDVLFDPENTLSKSDSNLNDVDSDSQIVHDMLGFNKDLLGSFDAARFLADAEELPYEQIRQALWQEDGVIDIAALRAYGLAINDNNLRALQGVKKLSTTQRVNTGVNKSEYQQVVQAAVPEAEETAEALQRAFLDHFVFPVQLGGKHSKGSLIARDNDSNRVWLLKPGAGGQSPATGGQSPATGVDEDKSTQSQREACFWHTAELLGLGDYIPRCDLVTVNNRFYAAIELLPWKYQTLEHVKKTEPTAPEKLLLPYLKSGTLHRWAILDFILGNPDRHLNNVMVDDNQVMLIDHGSAFAGDSFDPVNDGNSFAPGYLRAWVPGKYHTKSLEERFSLLPRVAPQVAESLKDWLGHIDPTKVEAMLYKYGIDAEPTLKRLLNLKGLSNGIPVDEAVNHCWGG